MNKDNFFNPKSKYYGEFTPEHLVFNANLQEFANKINIIVGLETGGKLQQKEAYKQIKSLFKQLKESKQNLYLKDV
jgi:hypothetical protein